MWDFMINLYIKIFGYCSWENGLGKHNYTNYGVLDECGDCGKSKECK